MCGRYFCHLWPRAGLLPLSRKTELATSSSKIHSKEGTKQRNSLNFLDAWVENEGTGFLSSIYRKPTFTGQYIPWNSFSPKTRKISLLKTLVFRARMICSKTKLGLELDKIKQLFIENGYPTYVLLSCINQN